MANCRTCNAAIIWARTSAGKPMPVDIEPSPDGNIWLEQIDDGDPTAVVVPAGDLFRTPLHKSHFATCPDAKEHRRRS